MVRRSDRRSRRIRDLRDLHVLPDDGLRGAVRWCCEDCDLRLSRVVGYLVLEVTDAAEVRFAYLCRGHQRLRGLLYEQRRVGPLREVDSNSGKLPRPSVRRQQFSGQDQLPRPWLLRDSGDQPLRCRILFPLFSLVLLGQCSFAL